MSNNSQLYNRALLFGKWYRSDRDDDGHLFTEFAEISSDGRYEFTFIQHDDHGKASELNALDDRDQDIDLQLCAVELIFICPIQQVKLNFSVPEALRPQLER